MKLISATKNKKIIEFTSKEFTDIFDVLILVSGTWHDQETTDLEASQEDIEHLNKGFMAMIDQYLKDEEIK